MNMQQLQDALGQLPEELIASTAQARQKKKVVFMPWVTAAACACLAVLLGATVLPTAMRSSVEANQALPTYSPLADSPADMNEFVSESVHAEVRMLVEVVEVDAAQILVKPENDPDQLIRVPIEAGQSYAVGEKLWIFHNGMMQETWPLAFEKIYGIERAQ